MVMLTGIQINNLLKEKIRFKIYIYILNRTRILLHIIIIFIHKLTFSINLLRMFSYEQCGH